MYQQHLDSPAQDCGNSISNALELPQSGAEPYNQYQCIMSVS